MKTLGLVFLGLLSAKVVSALRARDQTAGPMWVRGALYVLILLLVVIGAYEVGDDVAAANYAWTSERNIAQGQAAKAYANALRAVELRPGLLRYWQALASAKFAQRQFASLVADQPVLLALSGGKLDEEDAFRLASSHYLLAQFDKVIPLTQQMIRENRSFAAPYVLQGYAYLAQKQYPQAKQSFLEVLQMFPTQQAAVEGLAHVYFLTGNKARARGVLAETVKYPFPPEARQRFEALKALYAQ